MQYKIACRIPGCKWWVPFDFMLDTGATMMDIYRSDIDVLRWPRNRGVAHMGQTQVNTGYGETHTFPVIYLEVCLIDAKENRLTPWTSTPAMLIDDENLDPSTNLNLVRADGPLFRHLLHYTFVPNNKHEVIISRSQIRQHLPPAQRKGHRRMQNYYNWSATKTKEYGANPSAPAGLPVSTRPWPPNPGPSSTVAPGPGGDGGPGGEGEGGPGGEGEGEGEGEGGPGP